MTRVEDKIPAWDGVDLKELLRLDPVGAMHYRNRLGDANENGRSYGGQLLAQALMAASQEVPPDRPVTAMQFLFLQGALHERPLDLQVSVLQDGKRFSSRHVRGTQPGGRMVLDAHVTYAPCLPSPRHTEASTAGELPFWLPPLRDFRAGFAQRLAVLGGYSTQEKACLDFRPADVGGLLDSAVRPRARFWIRARVEEASPRVHEGVFAYLSDWWLNFSSLCLHADELLAEGRALYVASLNHTIWFHRTFRTDRWLHFDSVSPHAGGGRGLSMAKVHDEQGELVATVSQECVMAYGEP